MKHREHFRKLVAIFCLIFVLSQALLSSASASATYQIWRNKASTTRVYSTVSACKAQGSNYIGSLFANDTAYQVGIYDGCYIVMYPIEPHYGSQASNYKVGFVNYNGGVTNPYWNPTTYKNGSTREYVYSTVDNAADRTNSIGYLDPWETCTRIAGLYGYPVVLYTAGNTKKVGFVNYHG